MEKIVDELIAIEKKATAIMDNLTDEKSTLPKRINDEIARRTAKIDLETEQTLQALRQASLAESDEKVKQINLESKRDASVVEASFTAHRSEWRSALVRKIINGQ